MRVQKEIYCEISGRDSYNLEEKLPSVDSSHWRKDFYPYNTKNANLVGKALVQYGNAIRAMALPPGARIIEFGAGWGNLTMFLALMGYDVTAVELSEEFIDLVRWRAETHGKQIHFIKGDMLETAGACTDTFDAAIFVAAFHHCHDHLKMLESLRKIIPKGIIAFVMEGFRDYCSPMLPYPWGVNLGGQAVYFMRKLGWLEHSFTYPYLKKAVSRFGWQLKKITAHSNGIEDLFLAVTD